MNQAPQVPITAVGNNPQNVGPQHERTSSVYRRVVQSVFRDKFHRSSSVPCRYSNLDEAEAQLNFAQDDFLASLSCGYKSDSSTNLVTLERCPPRWEDVVSQEFVVEFAREHTNKETKRQMAVHELFSSEINLCYDLKLLTHLYQRPMEESQLLSTEESAVVFANLAELFTAHHSLAERLLAIRDEKGVFNSTAGRVIQGWISLLVVYEWYCLNLDASKEMLKDKMKCKRFMHFVQSCMLHHPNRNLDLDTMLDLPRSHLMQYQLLFNSILKRTTDHDDKMCLSQAIEEVKKFIHDIDDKLSTRNFESILCVFQFDEQTVSEVLNGSKMIVIKNRVRRHNVRFNRGKPLLILFDKVLVLARKSSKTHKYFSLASLATGNELYFIRGKSKNVVISEVFEVSNGSKRYRKKSGLKTRLSSTTTLSRRLKRRKISDANTTLMQQSNKRSLIVNKSKTLRLFSPLVEVKFDIHIKFRDSVDVECWLAILKNHFSLQTPPSNMVFPSKSRKMSALGRRFSKK